MDDTHIGPSNTDCGLRQKAEGARSSDRAPLNGDAERRALRHARYAAAAYPGVVGELISREIRAYVDAGRQLIPAALAPRLVSAMQRAELEHPRPPVRSDSGHRLAARPVPGSATQWRYPTAADESDLHTDAH
jgi:hypothetical protein